MEEHARELARGLRQAQRGARAGRLAVPAPRRRGDGRDRGHEHHRERGDGRRPARAGDDDDEEEEEEEEDAQDDEGMYKLSRALEHARESLKTAREEALRRGRKRGAGADAASVAKRKRSGKDLKDLRKILAVANTTSFLRTIQHDDVRDTAGTFYRMEGLDRNVPIPVAPESETKLCLREMATALASLTGVKISRLDRVQLPDLRRTAWTILGESAASGADAGRSDKTSALRSTFKATFFVSEGEHRVTDLRLRVSDEVSLEMAPAIIHCQEKSCFRTFFSVFADYGRFHSERARLFAALTGRFPRACKVMRSWDSEIFARPELLDGVSQIIRIRLRSQTLAFLIWAPVFRPADAGRSLETRAHLVRLLPRGPRAPADGLGGKRLLQVDPDFNVLAQHLGIHEAAQQFVAATIEREHQ